MSNLHFIKLKGKENSLCWADEERNKIIGKEVDITEIQDEPDGEEKKAKKRMKRKKKKSTKFHIQRYKGLGEMNLKNYGKPLWILNVVLKRVDITDAEEVNKVFDILMGSEVPPVNPFSYNQMQN